MPFLSQTDKRARLQQFQPAEFQEDPTFGEVFGAGVGQVVDEEMSISYLLNNEALNARKAEAKKLADAGALNIEQYTNYMGEIDYDRIASETGLVKSDKEVFEQRSELLRKRREYREDVFERGSGMAQFFGMATGFMLDPINIATMPIATSSATLKGMGTLARAMTVARNEAALAASAELLIQPLVYQHKHDINSPYSATDALTAIATAATGAAVLGGITGGLSGYLRKVREKATENVNIKPGSAEEMAVNQLIRVEETLQTARASGEIELPDFEQIKTEFLDEVKVDLTAKAGQKLTRGQRKEILQELQDLQARTLSVEEKAEPVIKRKGLSARQAKRQAVEAGREIAQEERRIFEDRISILSRQLEADRVASEAEADLTRISQGVIPEVYQRRLNELQIEKEIEADVNFYRVYEERLQEYSEPLKTPAMYEQPKRMDAAPQTISARERDVLERNGLAKDYDYDIAEYKQLVDQDTPVLNFDGENMVDAKAIIDDYDSQIEGLNSVLECALG